LRQPLRAEDDQQCDEQDDELRDTDSKGHGPDCTTRLCPRKPGEAPEVKKPLPEQVVVISGASSGIGRATARAAGRRGAKVVVSARNEEALAHTVAELDACGAEALAVPGDAASAEDMEELCARAADRFGRIDTVVATVMVTVYAEVERLGLDELER